MLFTLRLRSRCAFALLAALLAFVPHFILAQTPPPAASAANWLDDYSTAVAAAKEQQKMLLVWFLHPQSAARGEPYMNSLWKQPHVAAQLGNYVLAKIPADAKIAGEQGECPLICHPAFAEMQRSEGLAIIDYAHPQAAYFGQVVSVYPFNRGWINQTQLAALVSLPPGTLTQRTLIWAVRTHPEAPASTWAQASETLLREAECHACHQANIRLQGHHQWDTRFQRINAQIGLSSQEVCAESWPGQNLIEAAQECVHSWRQSSGHWNAVRSRPVMYGYDMKRGSNGIWYAAGIFGRYR
jgi:hypothetical protein